MGFMIIRYSMLDSFTRCPANFYKTYILGEKDDSKSSALEYGTALHLGIRAILDGDSGVDNFLLYWNSLKDVSMIYYRYGWQELRDLAVNKFLPNFERLHAKKFTRIVQELTLEMPFLGDHTLQGTPDIVCDYEGLPSVFDWKSSSTEYKRNKLDKNPQLYIYAALSKYNNLTLPKTIGYKVFRKDAASIQTLKKELHIENLDAMMRNVENIAKAMLRMIETKELYHAHETCYCKSLEG